jgi:DNA-binding IclR family transcriptional regulator
MTMLPRINHGYAQVPEEPITREEYEQRIQQIKELDWGSFAGESEPELYCAACEAA